MSWSKQNGYSLLELIVAFAVASSSLVAVLGIASRSAALTRNARDLTAATLLAQSLYAETEDPALLRSPLRQGEHAGRYRWRVSTRDHAQSAPSPLPLREVVVEVSWPRSGDEETYRLAGLEPDLAALRER
ncbi:MAG TPA: type II secretion system protein [Gammaproteobacteria bacterium]|nr:type II secretion system protein [Gammaproteobacteria bacterium]